MTACGRVLVLVLVIAACRASGPAGPMTSSADPRDDGEPGEPADPPDGDPEDADDTLPAVASRPTPPASPRAALVLEAHRELGAMVETHYDHRTHVVEPDGVFDYDCSGFVGYALSRAAPAALHAVVEATRARPLARHFEAFFASPRAPWTRLERAADLVPGDVIAWLEPPAKRSRNTGHVMIVDRAARPGRQPGEVIVGVVDSSRSGHGPADPRNREHRSGLGTGELVLLVDRDGRPTGYRWSLSRRSVAYRTEVALGHLP
jgi:hypothetical protein